LNRAHRRLDVLALRHVERLDHGHPRGAQAIAVLGLADAGEHAEARLLQAQRRGLADSGRGAGYEHTTFHHGSVRASAAARSTAGSSRARTWTGSPFSGRGTSTRSKSRGTIVFSNTSRASARSAPAGWR